ncbi:MAG TPA: DNA repair protein RecN [Cellvibrionaceae bacterium]
MLTHLSIHNFTLVDHLDLDLKPGMTVITGETGAGKSIVLDALGQTLGDRADATRVRHGADRADITANFDINALVEAQAWLAEQELTQQEAPHECLLRRMITAEGRSKAFINGQPVTLAQLRTLGEMLMDIHSQHEHQSLLQRDNHHRLLDEFAGARELAAHTHTAWKRWQLAEQQWQHFRDNAEEVSARYQLLRYQVEELDQLALAEGEIDTLEAEQRQLTNAEGILHSSDQLLALCDDDEQGLNTRLHQALQLLRHMEIKPSALTTVEELLTSAQIQVEEAGRELTRHLDTFELDPERLQQVEERLSSIYDIARKQRVRPEELSALHQSLAAEMTELDGGEARLNELAEECREAEARFRELAGNLSKKRQSASVRFAKGVNAYLAELSMEHARLSVQLTDLGAKPGARGLEEVELLISTNPGQPPLPLAKVASGGELSRVSLAINVVAAENSTIPSLLFDEVDAGIGGATASRVGALLGTLARKAQILCVTHLAQVASCGNQHLRVEKTGTSKQVSTSLVALEGERKIEEIARMLGGMKVTEQSLAHAREILSAEAG